MDLTQAVKTISRTNDILRSFELMGLNEEQQRQAAVITISQVNLVLDPADVVNPAEVVDAVMSLSLSTETAAEVEQQAAAAEAAEAERQQQEQAAQALSLIHI